MARATNQKNKGSKERRAKKTTKGKVSTRRKTSPSRSSDVQTMPAASASHTRDTNQSHDDSDWRKRFLVPIILIVLAAIGYIVMQQLVVATVNGSPISRITLHREMESQIGEQVLDSLITKELILQAARDQNIAVTDEEIDEELATIREQFESSGQNFEEILELQGFTLERVREEIRMQLIIEKAVASDIQISDEDIDAFIEDNEAFLTEDQDVEDEAFRADIAEQLKQQQIGEAMQSWIADLKAQANITYFGSFSREPVPVSEPIVVPEGETDISEE